MARKSTGRSRGRPRGTRKYPNDDRLTLELARRVKNGQKPSTAAQQIEDEYPDGIFKKRRSQAKRLLRNYDLRRQWFDMQVAAERVRREFAPTSTRPASSGIAALIKSVNQTQQFAEGILRRDRELRRIAEEHQRTIDMMTRGPFG
jgi:hypothetical protein